MTNEIEQYREECRTSPRPLPPDLDALLRETASMARAGIILPHGCGNMLLGMAFFQKQAGGGLFVASDETRAEQWERHWREANLEADATDISRDPMAPARMTVAERATLARIGESDRVRHLLEALRQKGTAAVLVEEPYSLSESVLTVLERIGEALPGVRVLGISSRPPYDLSPEERARVEAVCGYPLAAAGVPAMVERGILRPHRDLLYLCDPAADEETRAVLRRITSARVEVADRVIVLPFAGRVLSRLWRQGRDYLYTRREEVRAVVSLFGAQDPDTARRLTRHLGGSAAPTAGGVERAIAFLLRSQTVLSDNEKNSLRHAVFGEDGEGVTVFSDREEARQCVARARAKTAGIGEILNTEEELLGRELRLLLAVCREDAEACFGKLLRRGTASVAYVQDDVVYLPESEGTADRFLSLCRAPVACRAYAAGERPRYVVCRPEDPSDMAFALTKLFEDGDIRVLLSGGDLPRGGGIERAANVLLLTTVTEKSVSGKMRYAEASAALRGRALQARAVAAHEDAAAHALHIWHLASVAGQVHPLLAEDIDEATVVQSFLDCHPVPGRGRVPQRIPRGRAGLSAWAAAVSDESRKRRGTVRAFLSRKQPEEVRVCAEIPWRARIPAWTVGRVAGVVGSFLGVGVGGYLLPHLLRLSTQAVGMPGVLAIFLGLTLLSAGMVALGGLYCCRTIPLLIRHRTARASVRSLTQALLRALQESGAVGESVTLSVDLSEAQRHLPPSDRRFTLRVCGGSYAEADSVCRAVCEMLSPLREPRYIACRIGRFGRRKRGGLMAVACPAVLAAQDADARIFADCLRRALGRCECLYTRRGYGIYRLAEAKARGYLDREGQACRMYVTF